MLVIFLAVYLLTLPFQFALSPFEGIDLALSRLLAMLFFLAFLATSFREKQFRLSKPLPLFFLTTFLFLVTLSVFWSENREWALRKSVFLWNFLPLFFVFYAALFRVSTRRLLMYSFFGGAVLVSFVGFFQFTLQFFWGIERTFAFWTKQVTPFFSGVSFGDAVANYPSLLVNISGITLMRLSAFFPDPHMCSFYLGMAAPFGFLFFFEKQGRERLIYGVLALFVLIADFLTFSRGGYIGLVSGGIAFIFLQPGLLKKKLSPLLLGIFLPALLIGIVFSPVGERLWSSASLTDGSNIERLRLWKEASVSIMKNPVLGTGIGNYSLSVKPTATYREPIYVHNLFLDIAVEIGVLGALSFFGLLFLALAKSYTAFMKAGSSEQGAVFVSLMIFFGHSLFETPLFSVQILPILLLLLALSFSYSSLHKKV